MAKVFGFFLASWTLMTAGHPLLYGRELPGEIRAGIDDAVAAAYQAAAKDFPCRVKARGKPKMLRWEEVDRCLNEAEALVDWDALSARLEALRAPGVSESEFDAALQESLTRHALPYEEVLLVKGKDTRALLPLTNSLLKYLPPKSLDGLPVIDKAGTEVGTFAGTYSYERSGGLATANTYRLTMFQYRDKAGNMQSSADKLLLDSFGVPWEEAKDEPGFRLSSEKLKH